MDKLEGALKLLVIDLRNHCDLYMLYANSPDRKDDRTEQLKKIIDLGNQISRISEKKGA